MHHRTMHHHHPTSLPPAHPHPSSSAAARPALPTPNSPDKLHHLPTTRYPFDPTHGSSTSNEDDDDSEGEDEKEERSKLEIKREKNRLKQRNLRIRRQNHINDLESSVSTLRADNSALQATLSALQTRETHLHSWVRDLETALFRHGLSSEVESLRRIWGSSIPSPAVVSSLHPHQRHLQQPAPTRRTSSMTYVSSRPGSSKGSSNEIPYPAGAAGAAALSTLAQAAAASRMDNPYPTPGTGWDSQMPQYPPIPPEDMRKRKRSDFSELDYPPPGAPPRRASYHHAPQATYRQSPGPSQPPPPNRPMLHRASAHELPPLPQFPRASNDNNDDAASPKSGGGGSGAGGNMRISELLSPTPGSAPFPPSYVPGQPPSGLPRLSSWPTPGDNERRMSGGLQPPTGWPDLSSARSNSDPGRRHSLITDEPPSPRTLTLPPLRRAPPSPERRPSNPELPVLSKTSPTSASELPTPSRSSPLRQPPMVEDEVKVERDRDVSPTTVPPAAAT